MRGLSRSADHHLSRETDTEIMMHEISRELSGDRRPKLVDVMRAVWEGTASHGVNFTGGLHHAMADHAWGFCVYNDPAVAIHEGVEGLAMIVHLISRAEAGGERRRTIDDIDILQIGRFPPHHQLTAVQRMVDRLAQRVSQLALQFLYHPADHLAGGLGVDGRGGNHGCPGRGPS